MTPPGPVTLNNLPHTVLAATARAWVREVVNAYRAQVERNFADQLDVTYDLESYFYKAVGLGHLISTYNALFAITADAPPVGVFDVLQSSLRSGRLQSKFRNAKALFQEFRLPAGYGQLLSTLMTPWRLGPTPYSDNNEYAMVSDLRPIVDGVTYPQILKTIDSFTNLYHETIELRGILRGLELPFETWSFGPEELPAVMDARTNVNSLQWYAFINHGIFGPALIENQGIPLAIVPAATANPNLYTLGWLSGDRMLEHFVYTRHEFTIGTEYIHYPGLFPAGGISNADYSAWAVANVGGDPAPMQWNLGLTAADGSVFTATVKGQNVATPTGLNLTIPRIDRYLADLGIPRSIAPHSRFDVASGTWIPRAVTSGLNIHRNGLGVNPQRYSVLDQTGVTWNMTDGLNDRYVHSVLEMMGLRVYDDQHLGVVL